MNTALQNKYHRRAGFTLVEIMIVVAIIAMLAAIAVPNFQRARKRTHATRILEDLRVLEYALDRWAIENNKAAGETASFDELRPFLKAATLLYDSGKDMYGREYGPVFTVDQFPKVASATANDLADVAPPEFWRPYE
jgi:prepilin-type N-terminal cleavage/methylation domain-containing protein